MLDLNMSTVRSVNFSTSNPLNNIEHFDINLQNDDLSNLDGFSSSDKLYNKFLNDDAIEHYENLTHNELNYTQSLNSMRKFLKESEENLIKQKNQSKKDFENEVNKVKVEFLVQRDTLTKQLDNLRLASDLETKRLNTIIETENANLEEHKVIVKALQEQARKARQQEQEHQEKIQEYYTLMEKEISLNNDLNLANLELKDEKNKVTKIWTSNFSISLWENPKTHNLHAFGIFGSVHDSQNQYEFIFGETKTLKIIQDKSQIM